jgi:predicted amino acid-binding ACT domain protein
MEQTFIVITAQARIPRDRTGPVDDAALEGEDFCRLILGIVQNVCDRMCVTIDRSECFKSEGRMAMIIRADATSLNGGLDNLRTFLELAGNKISATVRVQKEDLFRYMHRI